MPFYPMRAFVLSLFLASPVAAQSALDGIEGLYGSAVDPLQSCATNPHRIEVQSNPPHLVMRWAVPRRDTDGRLGQQDVYDLRDITDNTIDLQREGDGPNADTGRRPIWVLRLTADGYCMGRSDWSPVRCVAPAVRCDAVAPTS